MGADSTSLTFPWLLPAAAIAPEYAGVGAATVATFAAMRALPAPFANATIIVDGKTTIGDSGSGLFAWDSASTATDDDQSTIQIAATPIGRFVRLAGGNNTYTDAAVAAGVASAEAYADAADVAYADVTPMNTGGNAWVGTLPANAARYRMFRLRPSALTPPLATVTVTFPATVGAAWIVMNATSQSCTLTTGPNGITMTLLSGERGLVAVDTYTINGNLVYAVVPIL
jgi:hypothetical protein